MNSINMQMQAMQASAFLQKHTHYASYEDGEEATSLVDVGAKAISNLIGGLVGGAPVTGDDDDSSVSTPFMRHRQEISRSYSQRLPNQDSRDEDAVPYLDFGSGRAAAVIPPERPCHTLATFFRGLVSPRATDMRRLLRKLDTQFSALDRDLERYARVRGTGDSSAGTPRRQPKDDRKNDPNHPLNNLQLMTEVHFVGRKATDASIMELTTTLMNGDKFGSITELWLNDNLISDDGAGAISSFLELPSCALSELWLGNNQIGPEGAALISGALSNNESSRLKCLGLYWNPIGNGGAAACAQMLRRNHTLTTLDVHGCGSRGKERRVLEGYGEKVITASDGTEYVARMLAPIPEEELGAVTDQRFLDTIQTFVAFNRINPTREQIIRGIMSSDKHACTEADRDTAVRQHQTSVSTFIAKLSEKPPNQQATNEEKRTWKDCEWKSLHMGFEQGRAAKLALCSHLEDGVDRNKGTDHRAQFTFDDKDEKEGIDTAVDTNDKSKAENNIGEDLDNEVVQTSFRSWHDVKVGIIG